MERRKEYVQKLHEQLGEKKILVKAVCQCLHNVPAQRPSAEEMLHQLETQKEQYSEVVNMDSEKEKLSAVKHMKLQIQQGENVRRFYVNAIFEIYTLSSGLACDTICSECFCKFW